MKKEMKEQLEVLKEMTKEMKEFQEEYSPISDENIQNQWHEMGVKYDELADKFRKSFDVEMGQYVEYDFLDTRTDITFCTLKGYVYGGTLGFNDYLIIAEHELNEDELKEANEYKFKDIMESIL